MSCMNFLKNLFKKPETKVNTSDPVKTEPEIDWTNPKAKISKYFTVKEALYLPSWNIYHTPTEAEKNNILKTAKAMDRAREFLGMGITVTVWIRPSKVNCPEFDPKTVVVSDKDPRRAAKLKALNNLDYNAFVGGAKSSAHITGDAVDWVTKITADKARELLKPKLEEFELCMENLPGSNWVHTDTRPPRTSTGRFFKP
jgi:hypothetical protein